MRCKPLERLCRRKRGAAKAWNAGAHTLPMVVLELHLPPHHAASCGALNTDHRRRAKLAFEAIPPYGFIRAMAKDVPLIYGSFEIDQVDAFRTHMRAHA